ncbi:MAG: hypothetical protein ACREU2_12225, partial [Steroidobacteraceae bacterium]
MLIFLCVSITQPKGQAQSIVLTNQDVVSMVKAGLPAEIIVPKIQRSSVSFDTSPAMLEKLKSDGIPDSVILAMVEASKKVDKPSSSLASSQPTAVERDSLGNPRVYVSDSRSWLVAGGVAANNGSAGGTVWGGSSPQTVEIIKTFGQRCPQTIVTSDRAKASYVVLFDRESYKGMLHRRDKIAVFRRNGDALFSDSVR